MEVQQSPHTCLVITYGPKLGCIVCPSPAQILDFFGLQVKNHQYKKKIKLEVISSFFMAMVSNTVFLEFFNNSWIWKIEKNSYVFLNLTFYVRNVPNQSKKSNNYWNLFLSILFLLRNFAHFSVLFKNTNRVSKYWLLVYFFLGGLMSCLNRSNMKLYLISSMARCGWLSFSVWKNMRKYPKKHMFRNYLKI